MLRPKITLNFAISADGKISTRNGDPSGWTSDADTRRYFEIRRHADAIMVARGTQEADNMSMTNPDGPQPTRIIVSRTGRFDFSSKVFQTEGGPIHLIATENTVEGAPAGCTVHHCDLATALARLGELGISQLLCEGGGQLVKALAALDAIDAIHLTWAGHTLIGGREAPTITGLPGDLLPASRQYRLTHFEPVGDECFLTYERAR